MTQAPSVAKRTLDNGLTVVLREMHHAPVISFMVWYRVGSRNERPGITGISHWLEHMMFKGTPRYPSGALDRLISREGGFWNAFTWLDFTAYFETMPAGRIDLALDLEADRMQHAIIAPEDVEAERGVILSERQMYEDQPRFRLNERVTATAFEVHPYGHEIIGAVSDLKTMTREDLWRHYRRHYAPVNAIVVAVGDFASDDMLKRIEAAFGAIPPGKPTPPVDHREPSQPVERRVKVNGPGDTAYLTFAYRAPAAVEKDYLALTLLNAAFAGGSSLGMFAGGGTNRSSRLYRALVDGDLAVSAFGGLGPTLDPYLYAISAVVHPDRQLAEVEQALDQVIEELAARPITSSELAVALKKARAEFVLAGESISGQAQLLGVAEAVAGDYGWYETVLNRLSNINLEDLASMRERYLRPENRVVGWYEPQPGAK